MKGTVHNSRVASDFLYIGECMKEYYVRLQYGKDDEYCMGFYADERQLNMLIELAEKNQLYLFVEQEYNFTESK